MNCKIMKPILASFGSVLQALFISDCDQVNLAHLASCVVLDSLMLLDSTISSEGSDTISCWTPKTFLPSLTELVVVCGPCLGLWAPLLEAKSTLVRLDLNCCHIGTNVRLFRTTNNIIITYLIFQSKFIMFLSNRPEIHVWNGANWQDCGRT